MDHNQSVEAGFNLALLPNFLFLLGLFLMLAFLWYHFDYRVGKELEEEEELNEPKDRD